MKAWSIPIGGLAVLAIALAVAEAGEPQVCGGIAGIPCPGANEFCKLPTGECCCDFLGVCTEIPQTCPEVYDPVCGCDGVTYENECFADAAAVSIDHLGPCGQVCGGIAGIPCSEGEFCLLSPGECCCDHEGVCVPVPEACPEVCDPVCGCDAKTYLNRCEAWSASVSIEHPGPCFEGGGLITGVRFESKAKLEWNAHPDALFYNVYRNGHCFRAGLPEPTVEVEPSPHPGQTWLFQVAGQFADGEGPLGVGWTCERRAPITPCEPAEQLLCESTGGEWDPLACGHYHCGVPQDCTAVIPGCNCGPSSNYQPGAGCVFDPACLR